MRPVYRLSTLLKSALTLAAVGGVIFAGLPWRPTTPTIESVSQAKVSFTFDDGYQSTFRRAMPILARHGFAGTSYVDTFNMETPERMDWAQIKTLNSIYGWEIGSHAETHPYLSKLPPSEQESELKNSREQLARNGITAPSFASPYGDYDMATLSRIAKYYASHRGFWDTGMNSWPANDYLLVVKQVQAGDSPAAVKRTIDEAIAKQRWLILVFHDIADEPSKNPAYLQYGSRELAEIAAYVARKDVPVTTISKGFPATKRNIMPNSDLEQGLRQGWSTSTPATVKSDDAWHGSYPNPKHSVSLQSGNTNSFLFSPQVPVTYKREYLIKSYLRVTAIKEGEVGYYIDEYDRFGNWVSGQWKKAEGSVFTENISFWYTPSSSRITQARVQIYASPHSGIQAYTDNIQWLPL